MKIYSYIILFSILLTGCKQAFNPPAVSSPNNYLVVEGVINTGAGDTTVFKLSRTVKITAGSVSSPETNAIVSIQDDQNQTYNLHELPNGFYSSAVLSLDNTRKYRINIQTTDGKVYASDLVPANITPPIDSIGFKILSNGIQLYANSHDASTNTRYYRYDYNETWQFHAEYLSEFITDGKEIVPRTLAQNVYQCYANDLATNIVLGSSAKLSQNVIYQNPITTIESTSEKIEIKYSILLNQYAITADAYNYFSQLQKNTEQLGSIFDAQPSQLTGNIHCTNSPSTLAIGYVTAGTTQSKRVYILKSQLPDWPTAYPYQCKEDSDYYLNPHSGRNQVASSLIPGLEDAIASFTQKGTTGGYIGASPLCADCTLRGTTVKPAFWQ